MIKLKSLWLAFGLLALTPVAALAAGAFPGYTAATVPLTGAETVPADTNLTQGLNPATELVTIDQLKKYMYGNAGTVSTTINGTATAASNAATLNSDRGVVTSEALTTAAGADYLLTLTDSTILATSIVLVTSGNGTNTTEGMAVNRVQPGAGSAVIRIRNTHASSAWNGTIKISFVVIN